MPGGLEYVRRAVTRPTTVARVTLVAFVGATLWVRVLTDNISSPDSRHSPSLNLSGVIATLFILVAVALLLRERKGVLPAILVALWLCVWTAIAIGTRGASAETLREGVREASIIALALIVANSRGSLTVSIATRLIQLAGFLPAVLALYQLATHTGLDVDHNIRSNGTFAHPNSAAMFFAIAATASLWRYLDDGRRRTDALLTALFAAALVATFSIDGLIALVFMLTTFGALHAGALRVKAVPYAVAGLAVLAFFVSPLGSQRIANESSTNVAAAESGEPNTSLAWRLTKWKLLLSMWESAPIFGHGLGTTITEEPLPDNKFAGNLPHNEYIRYLVETGIVGLGSLLSALALLVRGLIRKRKVAGTSEPGSVSAATLALVVIVGCLVNAAADNTFLYSTASYALVLLVASALSVHRRVV
jgi:O-antigen ligase